MEGGRLTVDGEERAASDPYALVAEELGRWRTAPLEGLPPFAGGAVGPVRLRPRAHGRADRRRARTRTTRGVPDLALMVSDVLVAFDHLRHEVTVLANVVAGGDVERAYRDAAQAIADVRERLAGAGAPRACRAARARGVRVEPRLATATRAAVERAKEYIRAGDVYQVVPSQRWSADCPVEAFSIYRGLRAVNPSPYMYFLDFEDFEIAGASPESLVKVSGRRAEQRPIAGTRPRAGSPEEDLRARRASCSRTRRSAPST